MAPPRLEVSNLTKRFGHLVANDQVSLCVEPGSFHALLGENGAGKSTLVKCLMGYHLADEGEIQVDGRPRRIRTPADAQRLGIGMVYQHFTLVPAMTVAENLLLARRDLPRIIPWQKEQNRLERFLEQAPFQVDPGASVNELAAGQKQKVEILKQLYLNSRLLILDEPTSVLSPLEAEEVLGLLHRMTRDGKLSVIIITHKFPEVTRYCDEVTVLRKGRVTGRGRVKDLTVEEMAAMMVGQSLPETSAPPGTRQPVGATCLEISELHAARNNGVPAVNGLGLRVRAGEIVGIAGVAGNGQRELVEVLAGQRRATAGRIEVNGNPFRPTRPEMLRNRYHVLPEEPLHNAAAPLMSVAENLALRNFDQPPLAVAGCWLSQCNLDRQARLRIEQFGIMPRDGKAPVATLSGGNVQRVMLARELGAESARILVAANPCMGLDFAAVAFVHRQLRMARDRGVAVLLFSEDLDELLALSDRLLVMSAGRIVYETGVDSVDIATLGRHMASH